MKTDVKETKDVTTPDGSIVGVETKEEENVVKKDAEGKVTGEEKKEKEETKVVTAVP